MMKRCVFVAGGTGYLGRPLIERLLRRGHEVRALARAGSERRLPVGCQVIAGNALDPNSYVGEIAPADVFIQLVGVAHPSPAKGEQFRQVDRTAGLSALKAPIPSAVRHFVYLSVAYPAPVMKAYIELRRVRGSNSRQWFECYDSSPVVLAGAGTSLAILAGSRILADGTTACDTPPCDSAW